MLTEFSCPDCAGMLKVVPSGQKHLEYQCQVGHRYSTRSLLQSKEREVERALWSAAALLQHTILVYERMVEEMEYPDAKLKTRWRQRIREAKRQKVMLTRMIENTHAWE
jgi:two-component system chemotaxis response regulator CheB